MVGTQEQSIKLCEQLVRPAGERRFLFEIEGLGDVVMTESQVKGLQEALETLLKKKP